MGELTWRCPVCLSEGTGRVPTLRRPRRCGFCRMLALGEDLYQGPDTGQIGILVHHQPGPASSTIWATIDDAGNLAISGTDTGTQVEAFFSAAEYEYYLTIPSGEMDKIRAAARVGDGPKDPAGVLLALKVALTTEEGVPRVASWLERHSITYEFTSFQS